MLEVISDKLNMPLFYFTRPANKPESNPVFWRGRTTATSAARDRAEIRLVWLREIIDYLLEFFDFPSLDLPTLPDLPKDYRQIDTGYLEDAAAYLRNYWRIGEGPMPDSLLEIENNGIVVSRINVGAEKLDAFSQWSTAHKIPFIVLGRDKASAVRQRFDTAHELFHLVAHGGVDPKKMNSAADYKIMEDQAHYFAGALLLPAEEFANELWSPTLDGMLALKERWKVSVGAMIKRCRHIGIVDDEAERRLWINYSRRGWRKAEPYDGKMEKERPRLLRRSIAQLLADGDQSVPQILEALPLAARDIEELCDLDPGTLTGDSAEQRAMPVLKKKQLPEGNVVSLFSRKDR
jgi:Zn-dependent peptidase ImmA (M78 family)